MIRLYPVGTKMPLMERARWLRVATTLWREQKERINVWRSSHLRHYFDDVATDPASRLRWNYPRVLRLRPNLLSKHTTMTITVKDTIWSISCKLVFMLSTASPPNLFFLFWCFEYFKDAMNLGPRSGSHQQSEIALVRENASFVQATGKRESTTPCRSQFNPNGKSMSEGKQVQGSL